jgi:hypothetical protein
MDEVKAYRRIGVSVYRPSDAHGGRSPTKLRKFYSKLPSCELPFSVFAVSQFTVFNVRRHADTPFR